MGIRAFEARINCSPELLQQLWRTHTVFNQRVPELLSILFRMRRRECGDSEERRCLYQQIARFILACPARDAPYLLNAVSIAGWKPNTALNKSVWIPGPDGNLVETRGDNWAHAASALSA